MNFILKRILDTDKEARAKKEKAEQYRRDIYKNIEKDKNEIIKAELEHARLKVEAVSKGFIKGADKRISDLKKQNDLLIAELQKKQQENSESWVDELYERVLK